MRRLMIVLLVVTASAASASALAAGGNGLTTQRRDLAQNRALWARQGLSNYSFRLRVSCFCPPAGAGVTVTVRHGKPTAPTAFPGLDTIQHMFAKIRTVLFDPKAGAATVHYDKRRGFPQSASLDPIKAAVDDEISWTIDHFRPLPGH